MLSESAASRLLGRIRASIKRMWGSITSTVAGLWGTDADHTLSDHAPHVAVQTVNAVRLFSDIRAACHTGAFVVDCVCLSLFVSAPPHSGPYTDAGHTYKHTGDVGATAMAAIIGGQAGAGIARAVVLAGGVMVIEGIVSWLWM